MAEAVKIRQTVDTSLSDRKYVAIFEDDIDMLCGMVTEMVKEQPELLLSPIMRRLLVDKAALVKGKLLNLRHKLVADNPCEDFK